MDGPGTYSDKVNNTVFQGIMKNGQKDSGSLKELTSLKEFTGKFDSNGNYKGFSTLKFANGDMY